MSEKPSDSGAEESAPEESGDSFPAEQKIHPDSGAAESAEAMAEPAPEPGQGLDESEVEQLSPDGVLAAATAERDQYLDSLRRLQAEFENYKKQVQKREAFARDRANDQIVSELMTVLDAFDGALSSGEAGLDPMRKSLLDVLSKHGLERIEPTDAPFDPELHEAVSHDPTEVEGGPKVIEVMRAGYRMNGKVLRPAMVQVKG